MTLMLLTSRPLNLQEVKSAVETKLRSSMERLSGSQPLSEEDSTALTNFIHQIDGKYFYQLFVNYFMVKLAGLS